MKKMRGIPKGENLSFRERNKALSASIFLAAGLIVTVSDVIWVEQGGGQKHGVEAAAGLMVASALIGGAYGMAKSSYPKNTDKVLIEPREVVTLSSSKEDECARYCPLVATKLSEAGVVPIPYVRLQYLQRQAVRHDNSDTVSKVEAALDLIQSCPSGLVTDPFDTTDLATNHTLAESARDLCWHEENGI